MTFLISGEKYFRVKLLESKSLSKIFSVFFICRVFLWVSWNFKSNRICGYWDNRTWVFERCAALTSLGLEMSIHSIPKNDRQLRACLICSMVKQLDQFDRDGCDNCERFLKYRGNRLLIFSISIEPTILRRRGWWEGRKMVKLCNLHMRIKGFL